MIVAKIIQRFIVTLAVTVTLTASAHEISQPPFVISAADKDREIAEFASTVLQEAVSEFTAFATGSEPIRVIVAASDDEFAQHAGSMGRMDVSGIARSWQGLIVVKAPYLIPAPNDFRGTLRHELVHVLLHRNSNTDRMPRWLNEGICMMLSNEFRWESMFTVARMYVTGQLIEYRVLDSAIASPESGMQFGNAYAQSLSMARSLRDDLGEARFWAVVMGMRELSFGDSLRKFGGIDPMDFWDGYRGSLWRYAIWGALTPSGVLGFGSVLVIFTWLAKQRSNRQIVQRWEREEIEDALYGQGLTTWDEIVEDPDAWKRGKLDENSDP